MIQFGDRGLKPVRATFTREGWESGGLDYGDYSRMTTIAFKVQGARRIPREATVWALCDAKVRSVIVTMVEARTMCRSLTCEGTEAERLAVAMTHIESHTLPMLKKALKNLCREVAVYREVNAPASEIAKKERQIASLDTHVRTLRDYPATLVSIIYRYFRVGEDSTAIAHALGFEPGTVRKTIHNIMKTAVELEFAEPWEPTKKWGGGQRWRGIGKAERERLRTSTKPARIRLLVKATTLRKEGWSYEQIARHREFGRWSAGKNLQKALQQAGMWKPAEGVNAKSWTHRGRVTANITEARQMYESGATCAEVAVKLNVSKHCAHKALKFSGVKMRPARPRKGIKQKRRKVCLTIS